MIATLTSFNVLNQLDIEIRVDANPFGLDLSDLFSMGARVNPKRSFLFVSKLIGKHLDVHPDVPKATGYLLANLLAKHEMGYFFSDVDKLTRFIQNQVPPSSLKDMLSDKYPMEEETFFIGFAETATGLAHSVFSACDNATFIHTTREEIMSMESIFDFEEEHSHAVDHRCYLMDERWIEKAKQIVLIDDEMTTGKTTLNLIRSLHEVYPKKKYIVLSLLDWRTKEQEEAYVLLEKELGIQIVTLSLVRGSMQVVRDSRFTYEEPVLETQLAPYRLFYVDANPKVQHQHRTQGWTGYLQDSGRFGIHSHQTDLIEETCRKLGEKLKGNRRSDRTLVMGVGEFMYLPSRIASYMGEGVTCKSTTRSPIYPSDTEGYPIAERISYKDDQGIPHFMYNMSGRYGEVFFLFEKEPSNFLMTELASLLDLYGIKEVHFVVM